eukprot:snap_masked-scaffold100_size373717-processed-gene-2.4 protein:Tk05141 transcript:snap_masked-scaffold100_size373717-processed-gene-2.4-mRNA-1 annotation:"hypothetical protein TcasGA2_TC014528"
MTLEMSQMGSEMGLCPGLGQGAAHDPGEAIVTSCSATVGGPSMVMSLSHDHMGNGSNSDLTHLDTHVPSSDDYDDHFEGLEVGNDHVPLGDILEKLESCTDAKSGLIRLHAASTENGSPTISATVNVSTLDLSDPESIHQHLSQLNDTVLKVSTTCLNLNSVALPFDAYNNNDNISDSIHLLGQSLNNNQHMYEHKESEDTLNSTDDGNLEHLDDSKSESVASLLSSLIVSAASSVSISSNSLLPTSPCPHQVSLTSLSPLPPAVSTSSVTTSSTSSNKSPSTVRRTGVNGKTSSQVCTICSKAFSNASALAKHRLTHSEERRYQCNICSKAFKRQDHLNGHLLTHRSTKPFACMADGCGKSYCDARSLRRHKENHHSNLKELSSNGPLIQPHLNQQGKSDAAKNDQTEMAESTLPEDNHPDHVGPVFKTKGLSPKQFQLIEQLIRDSKASSSKVAMATEPATTGVKTEASLAASSIAAKALAAAQSKTFQLTSTGSTVPTTADPTDTTANGLPAVILPDKPVECAICQRKFKNIPALNGHMRLHGGYYKKDADGRRILPPTPSHTNTTQDVNGNPYAPATKGNSNNDQSRIMSETGQKKRKHEEETDVTGVITACLGNDKLPPEAVKMLHQHGHNSDQQPLMKMPHLTTSSTASATNLTITPSTPVPNLTFRSLPPPNTSQLLANLEIKAQQREGSVNGQSVEVVTVSNTLQAKPRSSPIQAHSQINSPDSYILPSRPVPMVSVSDGSSPTGLQTLTSSMASTVAHALSNVKVVRGGPPCSSVDHLNSYPHISPMAKCTPNLLRVDESLDKTPKVGEAHQADIPELCFDNPTDDTRRSHEQLVWVPETGDKLDSHSMQSFLQLASSSLMPGASKNEEAALEILHRNGGDIQASLTGLFNLQSVHTAWSECEVNAFYENLVHHHKNFSRIAQEIGSKSVKDVVEFYYLWKNVCREESQSFKTIFSSLNVSAQVNGQTGSSESESHHPEPS